MALFPSIFDRDELDISPSAYIQQSQRLLLQLALREQCDVQGCASDKLVERKVAEEVLGMVWGSVLALSLYVHTP